MFKIKHILLLAFIFTAGCFTASVVQQVAVPSLHANSSATKWEQTCVYAEHVGADKRPSSLNHEKRKGWDNVVQEWGQQGWELVQMLDSNGYLTAACFKRPL